MRYLSTRGHPDRKRFCEILLEGLAPDGGLYLPQQYPQVDSATLGRWRTLPYAELAFEILSLYVDDIAPDDLRALCRKTYTAAVFGTEAIVPLRRLEDGLWLQALSNGPTLAFKDMAMQLLGHLFEYELARRGEKLNILGATSGDTGSAAEYAMRGKQGVRVFMTSPQGRMSPFQQAQMFSLQDANIHNLAVLGVFDDCQDIVKAVSNDLAFKRRYRIGTVNSINWARLLAQVVYYFAGYLQATRSNDERVSFTVPSGNFGNVCAGHVARMMGLPVEQLVVATNENDVLDEFFRTGLYRVRGSADTHETSSPSMDISKASNFERFVFDLLGRDAVRTQALFGEALSRDGRFDLSDDACFAQAASRFGFASGRSTHGNRLQTIRDTFERFGTMIDPHTADGVKVAREHLRPGTPMIVLETALPIKFAATIVEALGREPQRPPAFDGIEQLPKRVQVLPADVAWVKDYIARHCEPAAEAPARPATTLRSVDQALDELLAQVEPLARTETVSTFDADGRVLALDLVSPLQVPPADNSAMDGYAVRVADLMQAAGAALPVAQRIAAGSSGMPLLPGTVARIFTGAPVPPGANAVVMQEDAAVAGDERVRFAAVPAPGQHIRRAGEDVRLGSVVLARGHRLDSAALGMAASVGAAALDVSCRPRVALFSTGDELVLPGAVAPHDMKPGAIYNSNRFFLRSLLQRLGCAVTDMGVVPDRLDATVAALREAAQAHDLILTSGGVSVGEEDHVKPAVRALGTIDLWQLAIKPGKPFAHGRIGAAHFVGLPGNPVSSFVTFLLLVRPMLLKLQGVSRLEVPRDSLRADFSWPRADRRREFLRVRRNASGGLDLFPNQGSGVLTSMVWGDGLVDNPPGQPIVPGQTVAFVDFARLL